MDRLKCAVNNCKKDALIQVLGKFVCGECCVRINKEMNEKAWENINASS